MYNNYTNTLKICTVWIKNFVHKECPVSFDPLLFWLMYLHYGLIMLVDAAIYVHNKVVQVLKWLFVLFIHSFQSNFGVE